MTDVLILKVRRTKSEMAVFNSQLSQKSFYSMI